MDIIAGFGSLVIIPFLGILNLFKVRATPYLAAFVALWFILGVLAVGGGVTPMEKGDIVTPAERAAWFALPAVNFVLRLWGAGLVIGVPLLIVTWLYESKEKVSKLLKEIKAVATIATFCGALFKFIELVVLPKFFG